MRKMTYDIINAGPRNRFCVNGKIVHNSGRGPQPQNLPNSGPSVKVCGGCGEYFGAFHDRCPEWYCGSTDIKVADWGVEAVDSALRLIATRDLKRVEDTFGDAIATVAGCLRGLFISKPGHDLICSDYSAIEAVVLAQLAGEEWRLDVFKSHGMIYEMSAAKISGIPFDDFVKHKAETGEHHPLRKKIGKISELASGYQGGLGAWRAFGADKHMTEPEIKAAIKAWRAESPAIVALWYGLEEAAKNAIQMPGQQFQYRDITYGVKEDVLYCRLPSGRTLKYHKPRLVPDITPWGREVFKITYMGVDAMTKAWVRQETYGGKLTENCISEGTEVLTDSGWKPIETITVKDLVHDGVELVTHSGLRYNQVQACTHIDGVYMTPDHKVLTNDGWKTASQEPRPYRPDIRNVDGFKSGELRQEEKKMDIHMRVWGIVRESVGGRKERHKSGAYPELRMQDQRVPRFSETDTRDDKHPFIQGMEVNEGQMCSPYTPSLEELRGKRDKSVPTMVGVIPEFLRRRKSGLPKGSSNRQRGQHGGLHPKKCEMGTRKDKRQEQENQYVHTNTNRFNNGSRGIRGLRNRAHHPLLQAENELANGQTPYRTRLVKKSVFDIINCGPRNRFVVRGREAPFIVHNCCQGVARDILAFAMVNLDKAGYPIVLHVHDEVVSEIPKGFGSIEEFERIMATMPTWAVNYPLKAAGGWRQFRYSK